VRERLRLDGGSYGRGVLSRPAQLRRREPENRSVPRPPTQQMTAAFASIAMRQPVGHARSAELPERRSSADRRARARARRRPRPRIRRGSSPSSIRFFARPAPGLRVRPCMTFSEQMMRRDGERSDRSDHEDEDTQSDSHLVRPLLRANPARHVRRDDPGPPVPETRDDDVLQRCTLPLAGASAATAWYPAVTPQPP